MSGWPVFWLGTIAIVMLITAIAQVTLIVVLIWLVMSAVRGVQALRREISPLIEKAHRITDDAARATSLALKQVERVDELMRTTTARIDDLVSTLHSTILGPVRHGAAIIAGVRAALSGFWNRQDRAKPARDDEDAMFIG